MLYLFFRVVRWILVGVLGRWVLRRRRLRLREAEVEFYRELERIVARYGLKRPPEKTQREFALMAAPKIAQRSGDPQLADLPRLVVKAFYQVRFGDTPLDKSQTEAVEEALKYLRRGVELRQGHGQTAQSS